MYIYLCIFMCIIYTPVLYIIYMYIDTFFIFSSVCMYILYIFFQKLCVSWVGKCFCICLSIYLCIRCTVYAYFNFYMYFCYVYYPYLCLSIMCGLPMCIFLCVYLYLCIFSMGILMNFFYVYN